MVRVLGDGPMVWGRRHATCTDPSASTTRSSTITEATVAERTITETTDASSGAEILRRRVGAMRWQDLEWAQLLRCWLQVRVL